jgi:hypothetical protein
MSNSINKINMQNRRMIMSASLLNTYTNNVKSVYSDENLVDQHNKRYVEQESEQDENSNYILGYN